MLLFLIKLPLKLLTLPLILITATASVILKVLDNISSFIIGFFMLVLILCGVMAAIQQQWVALACMAVAAVMCVAILFAAAVVETVLDSITGALMGFLCS